MMTASATTASPGFPVADLVQLVQAIARRSDEWLDRLRFRAGERWFECVERRPDYDVWVITWLPGQGTGFHDHGGSAGAFIVAMGSLEEHRAGVAPVTIGSGEARAFGSRYAHDVRNISTAPAISIHAYSPPLTRMNKYELAGERLVPLGTEETRPPTLIPSVLDDAVAVDDATPHSPLDRRTIDEVLEAARARLRRLSPQEARQAFDKGALLVDIRPAAQRASEGEIPSALIVERNVLEWRFDPHSDARLSSVTGYELQVIVICSEGYTSSLAAAALQDLGLSHATDVVGGFRAWQSAGLPVTNSAETMSDATPAAEGPQKSRAV